MNSPATRGRPAFIATPLSSFTQGINGNPAIVPFDGEMCYDDLGDGSQGRIRYKPDGTWEFVSVEQYLNNFIKQLNYSGIFDNAAAGVVTRDLNYFFYNIPIDPTVNSATVVLNTDLVYPAGYKYYAIRNGIDYITGRLNSSGVLITNFVDMAQVPVNQGNVNVLVSKPEVGMILPTKIPVDGAPYIIEFFDATKTLVDRDVFYASSAKLMVNENSSDVGITNMTVACTRVMPGLVNATYLYRGENVQQLGFNVFLTYSDGTTRNITYELNNNSGSLTVQSTSADGVHTYSGIVIDTAIVSNSNPQRLTFTYTANAINNVSGNSINSVVEVFIIEDDTTEITSFVPAIYFDPSQPANILKRYFAVRTDGTSAEITSCLTADNVLSNPPVPGTYTGLHASFNLGVSGQSPKTEYFAMTTNSNPNKVDINGAYYALNFHQLTNKISVASFSSVAELQNGNVTGVDSGANPTHFNIRNLNGNFNYMAAPLALSNLLSSSGGTVVNQGQSANKQLNAMVPVLIEFLEQKTTSSGTIYLVTNIRVAYVTITN